VLARSGYREAKGSAPPVPLSLPGPRGTSSELREALNSPLPMDGLALTATAAAFRGESGKASIAVIVETPAGNIDVTEQDGKFTGALEIATVAVDRRNVVAAAETTRIDLQLTRETSDQLKRQGFRVLSKLNDVSAGRYQVRAAVVLAGSAKGGSVWYDIDVPDFSKGELVMSGLVIASARQGATPTGNDSKLFAGVLSILPTAVRQFKAGDELLAFAEVYANRTPALEANLSAVVKDDHAATVFRRVDSISASDFAAGDGIYRSVTRLPLADLTPGDYVLSIEATRKADDVRMADRAVPFRVVP
jgi:exosome complex RNA-binding protein Csl4